MNGGKVEAEEKPLKEADLVKMATKEGLEANEDGQYTFNQLSLERNQLTSLGSAFRVCPFIQQLDLSRNNLRSAHGLEYLPNLRKLSLYYNQIENGRALYPLRNHQYLEELDLRLNALTRAELYRMFVLQIMPQLRILDHRTIREEERQRMVGAPRIAPSDLFHEEYEEFENKEYLTDNEDISPQGPPGASVKARDAEKSLSDAKVPTDDTEDAEDSQDGIAHEEETQQEVSQTADLEAMPNAFEGATETQTETVQLLNQTPELEAKLEELPPPPSSVGTQPLPPVSSENETENTTSSPREEPRRVRGSPRPQAPRQQQRGRTHSSGGVWWRAQVADYPEEDDEGEDKGDTEARKELNRVDALLDTLSNSIHTMQSEPGNAQLWQQSILECREVLEEIVVAREEEVKGQKNEILQLRAQNERSLDQLRVRMQSSVIPRLAEADEDVARLMEERNNLKAELDSRNDERSLSDRHVKSDLEDDYENQLEDEIRELRTELEASKAERDALLRENEKLSVQNSQSGPKRCPSRGVTEQSQALEMLKEVHEALVNSNRALLEELSDTKSRHEKEIQQWNRNFELLKEHYNDGDLAKEPDKA